VSGGGELGHVAAGLGDDDLGGAADAGDGVQAVHVLIAAQTGEERGDAGVKMLDHCGQMVDRRGSGGT